MRSPLPKMIRRSQKAGLSLIAALLVVLAAVTSIIVYQRYRVASQKINYSQLYQLAESAKAVSLTIEGATLIVQAKDGSLLQATVTSEAAQQAVVELFRKNNVSIEFRALQPGPLITALNWLMPLLIFDKSISRAGIHKRDKKFLAGLQHLGGFFARIAQGTGEQRNLGKDHRTVPSRV